MGVLEIQVLGTDASARRMAGVWPSFCPDVHIGSGNVVYIRNDVASALDEVAGLTPLMISIPHLLAVPFDSALGEERFEVTVRPAAFDPVADEQSCHVIELRSGEMRFAALLPREAPWPHVMIHSAAPRRYPFSKEFTPAMERAFLAALRDAVRPLLATPLDPAA